MLRLQAESVVLSKATADLGTVQKVGGVQLYPWLGRFDFHDSATLRIDNPGGWTELTYFSRYNKTMVVTQWVTANLG